MDKKRFLGKALGMLCAFAAFVFLTGTLSVRADNSVTVAEINYQASYIKVQLNSGDTVLQISDGKQKKWETVVAEPEGGIVTMDISWISVTKDYILSLRGDSSTTPVKITIPKQDKNFKATYSPLDGIKFTGDNGADIEWKKKDGATWKRYPKENPASFNNKIEGMINKGATLMFRTVGVNGSGTNAGTRPSKEVSVTIKAKTAAPTVKIDESKMSIPFKKNTEYRVCDENGNVQPGTNWINPGADEDKALSEIASAAMVNETTGEAGKDVFFQFRLAKTATTQVSKIATVKIPGQKPMTDAEKNGIKLKYDSTSTLQLTIESASSKEVFEYCIITHKDQLDGKTIDGLKSLTWNGVTDGKAITINKTQADEGSLIYVRKKAKGKQGEDGYELPSPSIKIAEVKYPKELSTLSTDIEWNQIIAGVVRPNNSGSEVVFRAYSSIEEPVSAIKFMSYPTPSGNGIELASTEFESTVRALTEGEKDSLKFTEEEKKDYNYIVETKIKDTTKLEASMGRTAKEYYIYYKQGTQSEYKESSAAAGGFALYIHPSSVISNPTETDEINNTEAQKTVKVTGDQGKYETQFTRVYNSNKLYTGSNDPSKCDPHVFSFVVELGVNNTLVSEEQGTVTDVPRDIEKIVYDGITYEKGSAFGPGKAFVVNKWSYKENEKDKLKLIVTVDTHQIEQNASIIPKDELKSMDIYLTGGEVIKDQIKLEFIKTAFVVAKDGDTTPSNQSEYIFDEIDTTSSTDDTFAEIYVYVKPTQTSEELSITSVQMDGHSVCKKLSRNGNYFKVTLSKTLLNNVIKTMAAGVTQTEYIKFVFDNGFELNEGYKIVINKQAVTP